ncbi:glutathione peroxidase [Peribacillus sp. SCS-26]|uniref:glutathione peroxidase n=1 Tax=Paraperibacillus marinus TaxID=3115295 RepID=UPI00390578CB
MGIYQFEVKTIEGQTVSMDSYKDQVLLIVNTASKCGFTPQFSELESLYEKYKDQGFAVLGFPCNQFMGQEPGDEMEIQSFCQLTYGVSFPMFSKVDVRGDLAHPLFQYLTEHAPGVLGSKSIKWNFTKFLVDRSGNIIKRYAPQTKPNEIEKEIQSLL